MEPARRLLRVAVLVLGTVPASMIPIGHVHDQEPRQGPELTIRDLRVSETLVRSGRPIDVRAVVVNVGDIPALDVEVTLAVANAVPVGWNVPARRQWISTEHHPDGPLPVLEPGGKIEFVGTLRLEGDGPAEVGVKAVAGNEIEPLPPASRPVRIIDPVLTLQQAGIVFVVLAGALAAVTVTGCLFWPKRTGGDRRSPRWPLASLGVVIAALGPAWLWFRHDWFDPRVAYGGVVLFCLGWTLVGMGFWPRREMWRGAAFSITLYVVVGFVWVTLFDVGFLGSSAYLLLRPATLEVVLSWPFHLAQSLDLLTVTAA
jgi:hypothetical protein